MTHVNTDNEIKLAKEREADENVGTGMLIGAAEEFASTTRNTQTTVEVRQTQIYLLALIAERLGEIAYLLRERQD